MPTPIARAVNLPTGRRTVDYYADVPSPGRGRGTFVAEQPGTSAVCVLIILTNRIRYYVKRSET